MDEIVFFYYSGRLLPWQRELSSRILLVSVITTLLFVNTVDSIYNPDQGSPVSQSGGQDTGWNPGQGQSSSASPSESPAAQNPYNGLSMFTHGGGNEPGTGGGGTVNSFNSFLHQPSMSLQNHQQHQPAPATNILHQQQQQQPQRPATLPANLRMLLQILRSRVKNLTPATPTSIPSYYANPHNNYVQPQPTPMQYNYPINPVVGQQTVQPTQQTALQIYQQQPVFLQPPIPPKRPVPPVPPQQPSPFQQPPQQYFPPTMQDPFQQRPPPMQQGPWPAQQPQPAQGPQQVQQQPLFQNRPRPNYFNSYRYRAAMAGGECSVFGPPGQLCCDGIRNIPPKSGNRVYVCCGKTYFDPATHVCCGDLPVPKPTSGPPQRCCGSMLYDPLTQICCDKFPIPNPGGTLKCCTKKRSYNPATEMCCGESVRPRTPENKGQDCCGSRMYNPATHLCCNEGNTFPKSPGLNCCGKNLYSASTQMCCFGDALPKGSFCFAK